MYYVKIEGAKIKFAPFSSKNHEIKDAVTLTFKYNEEQ